MANVPYLIGETHNVVRYGPLRFWAERGLVHVEDSRDNSYETMTVREALLRVNGINDMIGRTKADKNAWKLSGAEIEKKQRFVEDFVSMCRKAQEQGMPDDPDQSMQNAVRRKIPTVVHISSDISGLDL